MIMHERLDIRGVCTATHVCKDKNGNEITLDEATSDETRKMLEKHGYKVPPQIVKSNLVVNTGRAVMAMLLGGLWETDGLDNPYINRITLGDGDKTGNLPNLTDTGLVSEIAKLDLTPAGTFLLEGPNEVSPDVVFPAQVGRLPAVGGGWGSATGVVTINTLGETLLTDTGVDFTDISGDSVQLTDQVTVNNDANNPLVLGVREVRSSTVLVLHNPSGYTSGGSIQYRIDTPGTQMLVSKLISGNSFTKAEYGLAVLVKEAGLLFSNDALFNRVVFAPQDEDVGVLLQSDETDGNEISVRFEWLVTF